MRNIISILLIITLGSCEDFFRIIIKVDPPEHTPRLVVHMYINDSHNTIEASISKSVGSLETVESKEQLLINDASVQIMNRNDEVIYVLNNIDPGEGSLINYSLGLNSDFGGNERLFKLEMVHPGLGIASAVQTMPRQVEISEPKFTKDAGIDIDGYVYSTVSFLLHDPADQVNYYQVKILFSDETEGRSYYITPYSNEPIYYYSFDWNALLLSDKTFNGKKFLVKLQADIYEENLQGKLFIDIKGITKDFFLYARSMYLYQESGDFGLMEPVSVYNNIDNGLGIFSLSSRNLYQVEF